MQVTKVDDQSNSFSVLVNWRELQVLDAVTPMEDRGIHNTVNRIEARIANSPGSNIQPLPVTMGGAVLYRIQQRLAADGNE